MLTRAAAARPFYTTVHAYLGYAYAKTGRLADARASYETAVQQQPDDVQVVTELGQLLVRMDAREEAEKRFRQALTTDAGHGEAWLSLGMLLNEEGRLAEAEPILERAAALRPDDPLALTAWGMNLAAQGRPAEGIAKLRQAVSLDGGFSPARMELRRLEGSGGAP